MPSSYDPLLRLELQVTGENENTWGDKTNTNLELLAQSIAGHTSIDLTGSGTYTLSTANAATDEARQAFLTLTGTLTGNRIVQIPTASKIYYLNRETAGSFSITVQMSTGTGVVLPTSGLAIVACDGTDCWLVSPQAGPIRVSVSSSTSGTPALWVTQTGGGPVFLAEDQGSDGSPFVINSNGEILTGTSVAYAMDAFVAPAFQVHRTTYNSGPLFMTWSNTNVGPYVVLAKSRGTAVGTAGAVASGDVLGRLYFAADVGGNIEPSAYIAANAAAAVSASAVPANLQFVTRNEAGTLATRMTLDSEGALLLAAGGSIRISSATLDTPDGSAPLFAARAWARVNNNGTILGSGNVASITRNAVGDFSVVFSTAMPDDVYAPVIWGSNNTGYLFSVARLEAAPTAGGFRVQFVGSDGNSFADIDPSSWTFAVFR